MGKLGAQLCPFRPKSAGGSLAQKDNAGNARSPKGTPFGILEFLQIRGPTLLHLLRLIRLILEQPVNTNDCV